VFFLRALKAVLISKVDCNPTCGQIVVTKFISVQILYIFLQRTRMVMYDT
jgi:hypothetical protein